MIQIVDGILTIKLEKEEANSPIIVTFMDRFEKLIEENRCLKKELNTVGEHKNGIFSFSPN